MEKTAGKEYTTVKKQTSGRLRRYMNIMGQIFFYAGLSLELFYVILDKSAYSIPSEGILFRITFVLFVLKVLCTKYNKKEWIIIAAFSALGVVSYLSCGRNDVLRIVVMCAAFVGMDLMKVLKYVFYFTLAGCLVLVFLSVTGIYGEVSLTQVFRKGVSTRYIFGMGHPNALHCMFFVLVSLAMYLYFNSLNWWKLLLLFAANMVLFLFTDSKTGMLVTTFMIMMAVVMVYAKKMRDSKVIYIAGIVIVLLMVVLSLVVAWYGKVYNDNGLWNEPHFEFVKRIDNLVTGRLWNSYGYPDSNITSFSLFSSKANTRYMDLGFYKLYYWYGYIPATVYIIVLCVLMWHGYKEKDYGLFLIVLSWAVYNFMEAHEISDYIGRNYMYFLMGGLWTGIFHTRQSGEFQKLK